MKCQNLWDTFLEKRSLSHPRVRIRLLSLLHKEGRKPCESARLSALARPHGQPFFAHARYFFSLDSSSAEMQCAVAAILARMAAAAMCDAAPPSPSLLSKRTAWREILGPRW